MLHHDLLCSVLWQGFIPNLKSYAILQAVGIIGSIIMSATQRTTLPCAASLASTTSSPLLVAAVC